MFKITDTEEMIIRIWTSGTRRHLASYCRYIFRLKTEVEGLSETLVNIYRDFQFCSPEDGGLSIGFSKIDYLDDIFNRKELDLKKYRSCGMDLSTLIFLW
jgi:hypothetical protein